MVVQVSRVGKIKNQLGEGPLWDPIDELLYWVDSRAARVHCMTAEGEIAGCWPVPSMPGSLALREKGGIVLALADGFYGLDPVTGGLEALVLLEAGDSRTRFNDGKTDRQGNFLAGTMGIKIRDRALSCLYRLNADLSVDRLEEDVIVANGPCFSPTGDTFYFNDGRRRILAYDYDPQSGQLANKRVFLDCAQRDFATDGATVDASGNLWTTLIGVQAVGCFDPQGRLLRSVEVPVRLPSSVMFGGTDLDILYVTSISDSGNRVSTEPGAGGLYQITGLGVEGLPECRFRG